MIGNGVESVAPELVVSDEYEQEVELHSALRVDNFHLPLAHLLALQHRILHHRLYVVDPSEEVEVPHIQMLGAGKYIVLV